MRVVIYCNIALYMKLSLLGALLIPLTLLTDFLLFCVFSFSGTGKRGNGDGETGTGKTGTGKTDLVQILLFPLIRLTDFLTDSLLIPLHWAFSCPACSACLPCLRKSQNP